MTDPVITVCAFFGDLTGGIKKQPGVLRNVNVNCPRPFSYAVTLFNFTVVFEILPEEAAVLIYHVPMP